MSWYDLRGSSHPTEIDAGSTYLFAITVDGGTTPSTLREELMAAGWSVTSIHPAAVTGSVRTFQVLATWNAATTQLGNINYAQVLVWVPLTGESSTPPIPWSTEPQSPTGLQLATAAFSGLLFGFFGYTLIRGVA
jgi:hypothetical protein